jgi:polysaccharide deacetylase family protein (PEP-CTERM system associated)
MNMNETASFRSNRHLLTVNLEDYFHVAAYGKLIQRKQWYRFETRFERNTLRVLDLLDRFNVKATFFVLGWVADQRPDLVREVARRGHEIASKGYFHRAICHMTPDEFREDLAKTASAIERAIGVEPLGFRAAEGWIRPSDLWALDILAQEGYAYDSSILPIFRSFHSQPWRRFVHEHKVGNRRIWEFPPSTLNVLGFLIPISGGNYYRQLPHHVIKPAVDYWHRTYDKPFVMYFHVWEFDPDQPKIGALSLLAKIRQYRNLDKMFWVVEDYFKKYEFGTIAAHLGLAAGFPGSHQLSLPMKVQPPIEVQQSSAADVLLKPEPGEAGASLGNAANKTPVTLVFPCYNEEIVLPYLANTLRSVEASLPEYDLNFIFVDDGSKDKTWESLQQLFATRPNCIVLRHSQNQGVAATIMTGIRNARTEIVCSADCDCTYDPHEIKNMIPLLTDDVDLVTASPYHERGKVLNVPAWRLTLSKASSFLYRCVLHQKLATYTSCFRVYRRSAVVSLELRQGGFLGVAEMLGKMDLQGCRIVEHPATLEVRLLGRSKMKIARTILGHLGLLARLLAMRILFRAALRHHPAEQSTRGSSAVEVSFHPSYQPRLEREKL